MKNKIAILSTALLATTLSMSAFAEKSYNSDTDHDHVGSSSHEHSSGKNMQDKMKAMQAEMQIIINTENKAKRLALFAAHKKKMKGKMNMMKNMQTGNCNTSKQSHSDGGHQGETD